MAKAQDFDRVKLSKVSKGCVNFELFNSWDGTKKIGSKIRIIGLK